MSTLEVHADECDEVSVGVLIANSRVVSARSPVFVGVKSSSGAVEICPSLSPGRLVASHAAVIELFSTSLEAVTFDSRHASSVVVKTLYFSRGVFVNHIRRSVSINFYNT